MRRFYAVILLLMSYTVKGQDIHFSHIHASPTIMNPAMTGLFDGKVRIIGNFRSQWNNFTKGYKTFATSVDTKLFEIGKNDFIGAGMQLYKDVAGDLEFTTSYGSLSFALLKSLDRGGRNYISFGMQSALMSNRVNFSNIIAFDNEPIVANGSPNQIHYWNFSAGLGWFCALNDDHMIYLGGSILHLNEPQVSFALNESAASNILKYQNVTIHGGGEFKISDNSYLKPNFVYKDQGPHKEILLGSFWKYQKLTSRSRQDASLYFGAWVRWYMETDIRGTDAMILAVRFDYKRLFMTFSFDANVSSLRRVSAGNGGPELSIVKIFDIERKRKRSQKVLCPAFRY